MASASYCLHLLSALVVEQLCRANLKRTKSPFFWQPHQVLFWCSFVHLQSKSDPVLAPPSLFGGLMSPLSQSLDWKTCIQTCNKVYVLKKFIFQSEKACAWPRYWKITAPNQTAMTLEETGKPLLCCVPSQTKTLHISRISCRAAAHPAKMQNFRT